MNKQLTTILFDLGNVLLDLDYSKTEKAFARILHVSYDPFDKMSNEIFLKYGSGEISEELFLNYLIKNSVRGTQAIDIIHAWNAMLLGVKPEIFNLLYELKEKFRLLIFSNTNHTHMQWVRKYLKRQYQMEDWVPGVFKSAYYSHELGYRKPDPQGFLTILEKELLQPEEVLFIDDHKEFVDVAEELGLRGLHKPEGGDLRAYLVKAGIIGV